MLKHLKNFIILTGIICSGNNIKAQSCNFTCKDTVFVSLGSDCKATLSFEQLVLDKGNCGNDFTVKVQDKFGKIVPNVFDKTDIGKELSAFLTNAQSNQQACISVVKVIDATGPEMQCKDEYADCRAYSLVTDNVFTPPTVTDNCTAVLGLEHNDQYFDLECQQKSFTGPFDKSRWVKNSPCKSNSDIQFSADSDSLNVLSGLTNDTCKLSIGIATPYELKLRFNWSSDGIAMTAGDSFGIKINGIFTRLDTNGIKQGVVATKLLDKGMNLEFVVYSDGQGVPFRIIISGLETDSKLKALVERHWNAYDMYGNKSGCVQNIFILKNYIEDVTFPANFTDSITTQTNCGGNYTPDVTGWPYLKTGKYSTSLGIIELKPGKNECLQTSYQDKVNQICQGSYEIQRSWKVMESCSGDSIVHMQTIRVLDAAAPDIACPPQLIIPVHSFDCLADVVIPDFTATDKCSPNGIQKSVSTSFGGIGFGPFAGISPGKYTVTYTAKDGCGNQASLTTELEVKDLAAPIAKCKQNVIITLDKAGKATVNVAQTDNASTDNCCVQDIKIKRKKDSQNAFALTVNVSCADAPKLPVEMKVTDCYGNFAVCESSVNIVDDIAPVVVCPGDVTISCENDLSFLDKYGSPSVNDNCSVNVLYSFTQNLNSCNEGTVYRSWQVSDAGNNTAVCIQNIHVVNDFDWNKNGDKIQWPADYTTYECKSAADLKPALLPAGFSQPSVKGNTKCTNVDVKYEDNIAGQSKGACIEINRKWTITEKCSFNASNGSQGKWEHTQTLKIIDNTPPVLNVPADVTVFITDNNCSKYVDLPPVTVSDCDPNPVVSNNKTNKPTNLSGTYQAGINTVEVTATDNCGNGITKTVRVTVTDGLPPQVLCKQDVQINLDNLDSNGEMLLTPEMISKGYTDNCTPDFMIQKSVFPVKVSCADLGKISVSLTVSDMSGNTAVCISNINLTDNNQLCSQPVYSISGKIRTPDNKPVLNANVRIKGDAVAEVKTQDGNFKFDNLTHGGNFSVDVVKDTFVLNGISTYDLLLLNEHILGKKILDSPYKYIAADVNQNNNITTADYVILKDLLLLNIDKLPNDKSWRFVPDTFQFNNYHPVLPSWPEKIDVKNLQKDETEVNFIGVKLGDLNFSNNPSKFVENDVRSEENVEVQLQITENEGEITAPLIIRSKAALKGIQFELGLEHLRLNDAAVILPGKAKCNASDFNLKESEEGVVMNLSWIGKDEEYLLDGDTLMILKLARNANTTTDGEFYFSQHRLKPEAYDQYFNIHRASLQVRSHPAAPLPETQLVVYPNPVNDQLYIVADKNSAGMAVIEIYSMDAVSVFHASLELNEGSNALSLAQVQLIDGLYLLQVTHTNGSKFYKKIYVSRR